jgi:hypothetical protein
VSVFMYGHNGRHFRLVALLKRPAGRGRLADLQKTKSRGSKHRGGSKPRGEPARETEPTEVSGICTAGLKVGSVRVSVYRYGESGSRLFERFTEEFLC